MAIALRDDLASSPRFASLIRAADYRKDAKHSEKCPNCDVHYTIRLVVMEDTEAAVKLLRERLLEDCPDHQAELYNIDLNRDQIKVQYLK